MDKLAVLKAAWEKAEAEIEGPDGMYVEDYQFADEATKLKLRRAAEAARKAYVEARDYRLASMARAFVAEGREVTEHTLTSFAREAFKLGTETLKDA